MPSKLYNTMFPCLRAENIKQCEERLEKIIDFHKSLKESENSEVFKGQRFLADLAELLECPVCVEVPGNFSFFQCKYGHIVCEDCHAKLTSCPVCRLLYEKHVRPLSDDKVVSVQALLKQVDTGETILHRNLVEFFRCASCLFVPTRSPVWLCDNSHLICHGCMDSIYPMCLSCKDNVDHPLFRNLFAEKILRNIVKPCRYASHGCKILIATLDEHENKECLFREVPCIVPSCVEHIPLCNYWDHFESGKEKHLQIFNALEMESNIGTINLPLLFEDLDYLSIPLGTRIKMVHVQLEEKRFIMVCHSSLFFNSIFFWVYYIGFPEEAENYTFNCRIFKEGSKNEIIISGPVLSVETSQLDIMKSPMSFEMSLSEVKQFWKQTTLSFSWEVNVLPRDPDLAPEEEPSVTSLMIVND